MKIFAKSRAISLVIGLVLLSMILPWAVSAHPSSQMNAQVISTTIPSSMNAGQSYPVSVTMKNTGRITWTETGNIGLGGIDENTGAAAQFGPYFIGIPAGTSVSPGSQYTFTFTMTAPDAPGYYTPKYRMVQDEHQEFGARVTRTIQVMSRAAGMPVAQFTASTTSGQAPLTIQFTDQSVSAGTSSYAWDINNDGTTDYTTKSPAHSYQTPGTYTVKLTVTNAAGSDSEIKTGYITVSSPFVEPTVTPSIVPSTEGTGAPKAQFTSNATSGKSPLFVQFTDQSTGTAPMTYKWDFSDGDGKLPENSQKNPVWRFWENAGTSYTVTLTVTNAYGSDTITKQNYITLGTAGQPTATPTLTPVPTRTPTPSPTPVIVPGGVLTAQFTASTTAGQAPLNVQFTDLTGSTGTTLYKWDVNNDGQTDYSTKNPSHTYTAAGTFTVKLTVTNASGSDSEVKTGYITVSPVVVKPTVTPTVVPTTTMSGAPKAQFTASTTSGQGPLTVQFTDQSVSAGTTTYAWDINNDGTTDYTIKSPAHTYQTAGTYAVKLTVTNASGSDSEIKTGYITVSSAVVKPTVTPTVVPTTTLSPVTAGTGEYGAEVNPTGNPIGGGAGYTRIISETDSRVKYVVSTAAQLITALKSAKSGEVVFVKGSAVIDMTANPAVTIPAGVTLASDRGLNGSSGALIKRTKNVNGGWGEQIFIAGGNNVRLTGIRLEGEMYPQDYGNKAGETYEQYYLVGIYAKARTGYEVDNCELRGFAWSAVVSDNCVDSYVHHNYIHHNQARGEGYGVALYGGTSIIEANIFDYNRHSITGTGYAGEGYEARYNIVKGNGNAIGGHHFDVHQDERGGSFAGNLYRIHHNTFQDGNGKLASIAIRQRPTTGMYIDHNVFETISNGTEGGVPIWERDSNQNMFATNNKWMGKLYPTNSGIVWFV